MSDDGLLWNAQQIDAAAGLPAGDVRPSAGFAATLGASFRATRDDIPTHENEERISAYGALAKALVERGYPFDKYWNTQNRGYGDPMMVNAIRADVERERSRDPKAFPEAAGGWEKFDENWHANMRQRQARDADTVRRGGTVPWLLGSVAGGLTDPINVMSMAVSGGSGGLLRMAAREAVVNGLTEAVEQPLINAERQQQGRPAMTAGEMGQNVAVAGLTGAALPVAIHGAGAAIGAAAKVARAGYDLVPIDRRLARAMGRDSLPPVAGADLAAAFRDAVPEHLHTPEQADALRVIERDSEIAGSSPFEPGGAGDDAHVAAMDRATARLTGVVLRPAERQTVGAPSARIIAGLRQRGLTEAQARGVAAGIHAESGGRIDAVNPASGAYGIGQWLGPRRDALVGKYGQRPSLDQQLDHLVSELRGGDKGGPKVLAQTDEAAVLQAYIRDFMRPAAGRETDRDLARGMAALGRAGEDIGGGEIDPELAALAREGDVIEMQRAELAREVGDGATDLTEGGTTPVDVTAVEPMAVEPGAVDPAPLPQLRRDLFPDETSWRIAQARVDAEALGLREPVVTRQSVWDEARQQLMAAREGEVEGALYHPDAGPIDVKWGDETYGLAHIVAKHPDVVDALPAIIEATRHVPERSIRNRMHLESADHVVKVRLDWNDQRQHWLLTAFRKDEPAGGASPATEDGGAATGARDHSPTRDAGADIGAGGAGGNRVAPEGSAEAVAGEAMADPGGPTMQVQADRLWHDLANAAEEDGRAYTLAEGDERSIAKVKEEFDGDAAAINALRGCL